MYLTLQQNFDCQRLMSYVGKPYVYIYKYRTTLEHVGWRWNMEHGTIKHDTESTEHFPMVCFLLAVAQYLFRHSNEKVTFYRIEYRPILYIQW